MPHADASKPLTAPRAGTVVPPVRAANAAETTAVVNVILLAFAADPVARWAAPDPVKYLGIMPEFMLAFGGNGFAHGSVDIVGDGLGAAMWLPPGVEPDSERMEAVMAGSVPESVLPDLAGVMEEMGKSHPDEPHWYLPVIGVDPMLHGRGLGSVLMRHALERADADGVPAYLESSNPRNISLYERHGFEIIRTIQVGSSPPIVPMLRRPR
jgi:ribosomal protein S18 acetylase RimI-like enzyme